MTHDAAQPASGTSDDPASVSAPLTQWLRQLAARSGVPGGGAASAVLLGVSAALMHMAAAYAEEDAEIGPLRERLLSLVAESERLSEADGRVSGALGAALAEADGPDRDARVADAARAGARSSEAVATLGAQLLGGLRILRDRAPAAVRADVGVAAVALAAGIEGALINLRADAHLVAEHAEAASAPLVGGELTNAAAEAKRIAAELSESDPVAVVRAFMSAFHDQDRPRAEALMADDFRFTSPQDDHIDRSTWLERCFPTSDHFDGPSTTLQIAEVDGVVLHRYEYLVDGVRWRNTEALEIVDGRVRTVEVYFGGAV